MENALEEQIELNVLRESASRHPILQGGFKKGLEFALKNGFCPFLTHVHTIYSQRSPELMGAKLGPIRWIDSLTKPEEIIDFAVATNIRVLMPTDHDCIFGVQRLKQLAQPHGILIVPAVELTFPSYKPLSPLGHLIVICDFENDDEFQGLLQLARSVREDPSRLAHVIEYIRDKEGYMIPAHPFSSMLGWKLGWKDMDGFELYTTYDPAHSGIRTTEDLLLKLSQLHRFGLRSEDLILTVGADAHTPRELDASIDVAVCHIPEPSELDWRDFVSILRTCEIQHFYPTSSQLERTLIYVAGKFMCQLHGLNGRRADIEAVLKQ